MRELRKVEKFKKQIALSLVLTFAISLFQFWNIGVAFASDRYTALYTDTENNTIRFIVKAEGYKHAYVVGNFNGWKKSDEYKLVWQEDSNDKVWKMMADIYMGNLQSGTYEYKYILITNDNKEEWINASGWSGDNSSFEWIKNEPPIQQEASFEIKASNNIITINRPVDLVVVNKDEFANLTIVDNVQWEIENNIEGARIENNTLYINSTIPESTQIKIKASSGTSVANKVITVSKIEREGTLTHFLKQDGNYDKWNYWSYEEGKEGAQVDFTENTDLGKSAYLTNSQVIVRKGNWDEETPMYKVPLKSQNAYIIKGDSNIYTSLREAIIASGARITTAIMDSKDNITAYLSEKPLPEIEFKLFIDGVEQQEVGVIVYPSDKKVEFDTSVIKDKYNPTSLIEVKADNMFTVPAPVLMRNVLDSYYYSGNDMGAIYTEDKINLRLWAPTAYKVEVLVYDNANQANEESTYTYEMNLDSSNGTHFVTIDKNLNYNKYYMYRLYFKSRNTAGELEDKITYAVDPYANAVGINGDKGALIDLNDPETIPENWEEDKKPNLVNPEDSIIYEMHVRDFTIDENWGGNSEYAGKYLGIVQEGTTYTDKNGQTVSTGLDHLKELGVTHVHLLPVYDIASVDEDGDQSFDAKKENGEPNRNWGYDPKNYNVPEGSYSTKPEDPKTRILEFRQMVQGLHRNGIRVVLDMVYNHMATTDNMNNIVPGYYFRSWQDGSKSNGSGCGNEVASERPMVRKFIIDSNIHWVNNYKIDGLRFDLMALLDKTTMNQIESEVQTIDPSIIVYGEPWKAADSPLSWKEQTTKNKGISAFNDTFRDALRGNNHPGKGFINGNINSDISNKVQEGIKGSINGTVDDPELTINYTEAHDNYAIWDQVEKSETGIKDGEYRQNISENALEDWKVKKTILGNGIVITSQGIPFFQGGSEILRTKQGDHNSYKSDDETNDIDWADKAEFKEVFDYYKGLIQLRKEHPAFRLTSNSQIRDNQEVYTLNNGDNGIIIQHLKDNANGDKWKNILVIYNGSADSKTVTWLPESSTGTWNVVVDHTGVNLENPITKISQDRNNVNLTVSPNSMMVMYDVEDKEEVTLTIDSGDYESGIWTNDEVEISVAADDSSTTLQYSLNDGKWTEFNGQILVVESGRYNYKFRAVNWDKVLSQEYEFIINIDKTNPNITLTPNVNVTDFVASDIKVRIEANDTLAGIKEVTYTTNEATPQSGTVTLVNGIGEITLSNNGEYILTVSAKDNSLNEEIASVTVKIDKELPKVEVNADTETIGQNVNISVTANAGISEVSKVEVQKSGEEVWTDITSSYASGYEVIENGTYRFRVTNGAGVTAVKDITINNIDNKKPVININSNGYINGSWSNKDVILNVSNTATLGTTKYEYKLNDGAWTEFNGEVKVTTEGTYNYSFRAISQSGIVSDVISFIVNVDKTAPTNTEIKVKENSFKELINNITFGLFFKESVEITITADANISGLGKVEYQKVSSEADYDENGEWTKYTNKLTISPDEKFIVYARVTDNAGNSIIANTNGVIVDDTNPNLTLIPNVNVTDFVASDIKVRVEANDTLAGIKEVTYTTNEATPQSGTVTLVNGIGEITLSNNGEYTLTVSAKDNSLNEEIAIVTVKIDKELPKVEVNADTETIGQNVNISVTANAGISEVSKVEVQKSGEEVWTDITSSYASGYEVIENGTYRFRVTNRAGVTAVKDITINNIININNIEDIEDELENLKEEIKNNNDLNEEEKEEILNKISENEGKIVEFKVELLPEIDESEVNDELIDNIEKLASQYESLNNVGKEAIVNETVNKLIEIVNLTLRKHRDTGVRIEDKDNKLPLNVKVGVVEIHKETVEYKEAENAIENTLKDKKQLLLIDISLLIAGETYSVSRDNNIKVRIPLIDEYKNEKNLEIVYIDDNNNVVRYRTVIEDGYVVFETNHFSKWALIAGDEKFVDINDVENEDILEDKNNSDKEENLESDDNSEKEQNTIDKILQTGKESVIIIMLGAIIIIIAGAILLTSNKKKALN